MLFFSGKKHRVNAPDWLMGFGIILWHLAVPPTPPPPQAHRPMWTVDCGILSKHLFLHKTLEILYKKCSVFHFHYTCTCHYFQQAKANLCQLEQGQPSFKNMDTRDEPEVDEFPITDIVDPNNKRLYTRAISDTIQMRDIRTLEKLLKLRSTYLELDCFHRNDCIEIVFMSLFSFSLRWFQIYTTLFR